MLKVISVFRIEIVFSIKLTPKICICRPDRPSKVQHG
jgi:hypothetical protein